jgi:hypothetical protein
LLFLTFGAFGALAFGEDAFLGADGVSSGGFPMVVFFDPDFSALISFKMDPISSAAMTWCANAIALAVRIPKIDFLIMDCLGSLLWGLWVVCFF